MSWDRKISDLSKVERAKLRQYVLDNEEQMLKNLLSDPKNRADIEKLFEATVDKDFACNWLVRIWLNKGDMDAYLKENGFESIAEASTAILKSEVHNAL